MSPEVKANWDVAAEFVKIIGAIIAFALSLSQYVRAQRWKRREFIAAQIRDFDSDEKIQAALRMLDWTGRRVFLRSDETGNIVPTIVDEYTLSAALLSHSSVSGFTATQASIRDCFDQILDALGRLETFVYSELITKEELLPYIEYWVQKIAGKPKPQHSEDFYILLHHYMRTYGFERARLLLKSYGCDIDVQADRLVQAEERIILAASERGIRSQARHVFNRRLSKR
jgi:hypothetical protein